MATCEIDGFVGYWVWNGVYNEQSGHGFAGAGFSHHDIGMCSVDTYLGGFHLIVCLFEMSGHTREGCTAGVGQDSIGGPNAGGEWEREFQ